MRKFHILLILSVFLVVLCPILTYSQEDYTDLYKLSKVLHTGSTHIRHTAIGDVNNDGFNDIVAISTQNSADDIFDPENDFKIFLFFQDSLKNPHSFLPPVRIDYPYTPGLAPTIFINDLNNDGLNDVIITLENGFGILYQMGGGSYASVMSFEATHKKIAGITIGDFNHDGRKDIVVPTEDETLLDTYYLEIFLQTNSGTLATPVLYETPFKTAAISMGKLNGDNLDDIVIGGASPNSGLAIFLQNAGGTMNTAVEYDAENSIYSIDVGDLNSDDRNDIAVCYLTGDYTIGIFYQDANNNFVTPPVYPVDDELTAYKIKIADANRDGLNDIILSGSGISILEQKTNGNMQDHFIEMLIKGTRPNQNCSFGDINDDKLNDIVLGVRYDGIHVTLGLDKLPAIILRSPNGGRKFPVFFKANVWMYFMGNIKEAAAYYSIDGGSQWHTIADSIDATKGIQQVIPWEIPPTVSNNCLVKVTDTDSGIEDISYYAFSIVDDGVDRLILSSPENGDELVANTYAPIYWYRTGTVSDVRLEYSTDNGNSWTTIISPTDNDGYFDWRVPNTPSTTCKIRITDINDSSTTDTSNGTFTIYAPGTEVITVTSPNGGESLTGGSTHTITWTHTGNIPMVTLAYSIDNGANWSNIANISNTGSYTWTVPPINSHQCLIEVRDTADNSPSDRSNNTFTISSIVGPSITILSPNGGEYLFTGRTHDIHWQSTTTVVGNVHIQYSANNGSSWTTIVQSTANDGHYGWTIPNVKSTQCLVRISEASDNDPSDISDSVFTIAEAGATLSITSPQNGDNWQVNSKQTIKWVKGSNTTSKVKLEYSIDNQSTWKTISSSTANDGSYSWTIPNTPSSKCNVKITDVSKPEIYNISYGSFSIVSGSGSPVINLNRTALYFNSVKLSSSKTPPQTINVDNGGYDTLHWTASIFEDDEDGDEESRWLKIQNYSGVQSGQVTVSVNPSSLAVGTYDGAIKFSDNDASNSPQMVSVIFNVKAAGSDANPFGAFETPVNNSTVMSSIPVTGWAIDDIGIEKVTIWRNAVSGEGSGQIYIGDAVLVEGARPDVEQAYPSYPMGYQAGWGYMLLTNMLPNNGNGTFTLHAYAKDVGGHQVKLGSKTITCDNANAVKPFGAIDSPAQGGDASLNSFRNQGWVLTPMPNKIPENGSTIKMYIDGQMIGTCHYNIYRDDIFGLFPGYANSNGAMAYIDFDTTVYDNGIHTIQWVATDNAGNTDGIGSRYFTIQNSGYNRVGVQNLEPLHRNKKWTKLPDLNKIPINPKQSLNFKKGFSEKNIAKTLPANENGSFHISIPQNERLVLNLPQLNTIKVYMQVNNHLRPLPPGASLNESTGTIYWQPGPASLGKFKWVFISNTKDGKIYKNFAIIEITPKFFK